MTKRTGNAKRTMLGVWIVCAVFWMLIQGGTGVQASCPMTVKHPSQKEIREMAERLDIRKELPNTYLKKPSYGTPLYQGEPDGATLTNALNTLNFIRFVAGVPSSVKMNAAYQDKAQAASLVLSLLGRTEHYPPRPFEMREPVYESLYLKGYEGTSSSNLASGFSGFYDTFIHGWMSDDDPGNIAHLGHRRWCLNPGMEYTGFGVNERYYVMYVFDGAYQDKGVRGVAWPAQNMPLELFDKNMPWSISMGTVTDPRGVSVTLKRIRDGRTWRFSPYGSQGDFHVSNENYGQKGCIIFRPEGVGEYRPGDRFLVTVSGAGTPFSYEVNFFSLAASFVSEKPAPGTPVLKAPRSLSPSRIRLSWSAVAGADGYRVYRRKPGGNWRPIATLSGKKTAYTDSRVVTGTLYEYTVRAFIRDGGKMKLGAYDPSGVRGRAVLGKVSLSATNTSGGNILRWKPVPEADGYEIRFKEGKGTCQSLGFTKASSKSHGNLKPGMYSYKVRPYRLVSGGKKVYGPWSSVKRLRVGKDKIR